MSGAPPASAPDSAIDSAITEVCLACGLCCQGAMYTRVQIQGSEIAFIEGLGLPVVVKEEKTYFTQPCLCFEGGKCGIYASRPQQCRDYYCQLIAALRSGEVDRDEALKLVTDIRARFDLVRKLLNPAGNPMSVNEMVAQHLSPDSMTDLGHQPPEKQQALLQLGVMATQIKRYIDRRYFGLA